MLRITSSLIVASALAGTLAFTALIPSVAVAGNGQYNRGCADAKAGSYDRAHHNADYEKGWQACKNKAPAATAGNGSEYNRGCADAKANSYDRARHNDEYERGWQACTKQQPAAAAAKGSPTKWEQACLAAVSNKANNGEVTILDSTESQANNVVVVGVGNQRAPWKCWVSSSGVVQDVQFSGDEGRM